MIQVLLQTFPKSSREALQQNSDKAVFISPRKAARKKPAEIETQNHLRVFKLIRMQVSSIINSKT